MVRLGLEPEAGKESLLYTGVLDAKLLSTALLVTPRPCR